MSNETRRKSSPAAHKRPAPRRPSPATARRPQVRRALSSKRRPWWQSPTTLGGAALGIVVIAVVVAVVLSQAPSSSGPAGARTAVPASVLTAVTQADTSELAQIGSGGQPGNLSKLPGPTVSDSSGKPVVIYAGAEYCPYCAAERWAIVAALSRFGSFAGLQETTSSSTDVYPGTSTFSFVNTTYSSSWIDFQSAELEDRNQQPLQSPAPEVASAFNTYDRPPYTSTVGGFPFLDIASRFTLSKTSFSPQLLQGLSWDQIASQLSDPKSQVAQAILGNANIITAAICSATNNQPPTVCSAPDIQSIETTLPR